MATGGHYREGDVASIDGHLSEEMIGTVNNLNISESDSIRNHQ